MKRLIPLAALLLLGAGTTTHALYFGASYVNTDAEFREAVDTFSTDDSSYKLYAGFRMSRYLDAEVSYRDLGQHVDTSGPSRLAVDLEAYDVGLRAVMALGRRLTVFARAGYANVSRKGEADLSGVTSSIDDDEWDVTYGAGFDYGLSRRFGLRAEWEAFEQGESLNSFSAGVFVSF